MRKLRYHRERCATISLRSSCCCCCGQEWYNTDLVVVAFSSRARIWGECSTIHPRLRFFFFFWVEISSRKLIPQFRPGSVHSGSASCDDCDRVFPDKLRVSSFPDRFLHSAWTTAKSAHPDFDGSGVYACLGVACHLNFLQNDRGLLHATAVTRGWNGHRIRFNTQS